MADLFSRSQLPPMDDGPMSRKVFAINMARAFRAYSVVRSVTPHDEEFRLDVAFTSAGQKLEAEVHLDSFYTDYLRHHSFQREAARCTNGILAADSNPLFFAATIDPVIDQLYPKLERREYLIKGDRQQPEENRRVYIPFHSDLAVAYVYDTPSSVAYIPHRLLDRWGLSIDELHDRTMPNLLALAQKSEWPIVYEENLPTMIDMKVYDGFAATRLLCGAEIRAIWAAGVGPIVGELIALAPHRDKLMIIDAPDLETGKTIASAAKKVFEQRDLAYRLSSKIVPVPWDNSGRDR